MHLADPSNTSFKNHLFTPAPRCVKPVLDLDVEPSMQSPMSDCVYYNGELWLSLVRVKIDQQYLSSCAARLATCFSRAIINADGDWRITNTSMTLVPLELVDTSNGSPIFYVDHEESSQGTYPFPVLQSKGEVRLLYLLCIDSWCAMLISLAQSRESQVPKPFFR